MIWRAGSAMFLSRQPTFPERPTWVRPESFPQEVKAPTRLIVGGYDQQVITMNREALEKLPGEKEMVIIPEASHLFEERGTLEEVARLAVLWFQKHLSLP